MKRLLGLIILFAFLIYILPNFSNAKNLIQQSFATNVTVTSNSSHTKPLHVKSINLSDESKQETQLFELTNKERVETGLPALVLDQKLSEIARDYAKKMWKEGFFGHVDLRGSNVSIRLSSNNVSFKYAGENLALTDNAIEANKGLMKSQSHKENILDINFQKIGIGAVSNKNYGTIFVQIFTGF